MLSRKFTALFLTAIACSPLVAAVKDVPFRQDVSVKFKLSPELNGVTFHKVAVNRDGIVYVLTSKGVARLFESTLALDKSFRPLTGQRALDLALHGGELFYLFEDRFLSNGSAGHPLGHLPRDVYQHLVLVDDGRVLLAGTNGLGIYRNGQLTTLTHPTSAARIRLFAWRKDFFAVLPDGIYRLAGEMLERIHQATDLTTLSFRGNEMLVGTRNGFFSLDVKSGQTKLPRQAKLPATNVTVIAPVADGLWVGTTRGAFHQNTHGGIRYYASKRWLADDEVIDLQPEASGDVYVLTKTGLNQIKFERMTLAEKAAHYEKKIRQRHIRYGFCAELRLRVPGDITSAEMIDTDNDGTWSNYYMASQAFHFAATGDPQAWSSAWQTFEAFERLESINGLSGFPSRTFERIGFKYSDPERWHPAPGGNWEWKAHTSSDEIAAHTFGCAVMHECVAKTAAEKNRIAAFFDKIMSHIVRNNFYLIDVDGKPTLWGRWHPEYVNWYPPSIVDRRLNSAEIIASLQLAYKLTGKPLYREKALELIERHGYLTNIMSSMANIAFTKGYVHLGHDMGDEWNHSDDLLAFVTYWVLHRYAFNTELKKKFAAAINDHFVIERIERCPLWHFVYASTGAKNFEVEGALWTLRHYPLDLIDWRVTNSHRRDLTRLPPNFRNQQTVELLPPDERRIMRWNGNPFALDGGSDGHTELAGDEFLLPYWMGRYLKIIE